jgi:hypothetical protein
LANQHTKEKKRQKTRDNYDERGTTNKIKAKKRDKRQETITMRKILRTKSREKRRDRKQKIITMKTAPL